MEKRNEREARKKAAEEEKKGKGKKTKKKEKEQTKPKKKEKKKGKKKGKDDDNQEVDDGTVTRVIDFSNVDDPSQHITRIGLDKVRIKVESRGEERIEEMIYKILFFYENERMEVIELECPEQEHWAPIIPEENPEEEEQQTGGDDYAEDVEKEKKPKEIDINSALLERQIYKLNDLYLQGVYPHFQKHLTELKLWGAELEVNDLPEDENNVKNHLIFRKKNSMKMKEMRKKMMMQSTKKETLSCRILTFRACLSNWCSL